jgi:hypothetical protein
MRRCSYSCRPFADNIADILKLIVGLQLSVTGYNGVPRCNWIKRIVGPFVSVTVAVMSSMPAEKENTKKRNRS